MRKIVAFSGGFDSTLALVHTLNESSPHDEIRCISIYHEMTGLPKLNKEREARAKIIKFLREKYPDHSIKNEEMRISLDWKYDGKTNKGLSQPIFWVCNLAPLVEDGDELVLGYINGDQAMTEMHSIYQLWNSAMRIQKGKRVRIKLPLQYTTKSEVIKHLINYHEELVDMCFSCESLSTRDEACGYFEPCEHLKSALVQLVLTYSDRVSTKARSMLKDRFNIEISVDYGSKDKADDKIGNEPTELES